MIVFDEIVLLMMVIMIVFVFGENWLMVNLFFWNGKVCVGVSMVVVMCEVFVFFGGKVCLCNG